jgi:hypothetical protein
VQFVRRLSAHFGVYFVPTASDDLGQLLSRGCVLRDDHLLGCWLVYLQRHNSNCLDQDFVRCVIHVGCIQPVSFWGRIEINARNDIWIVDRLFKVRRRSKAHLQRKKTANTDEATLPEPNGSQHYATHEQKISRAIATSARARRGGGWPRNDPGPSSCRAAHLSTAARMSAESRIAVTGSRPVAGLPRLFW